MNFLLFLILLAASVCAASGQFLFKIGADGRRGICEFMNLWIFGGLSLYGLGTLMWIFALSKAQLIQVYPFTVLTFVLVYLMGCLLLHEQPTTSSLIGASLVLAGLLLMSLRTV